MATAVSTGQPHDLPLAIGCTAMRHKVIGIHAVVNARGGLQRLNQQTMTGADPAGPDLEAIASAQMCADSAQMCSDRAQMCAFG